MTNRVLIVTLWDNANFGNRLQAYATRRLVEMSGYQPVCAVSTRTGAVDRVMKAASMVLGPLHVRKFRKKYFRTARGLANATHTAGLYKPVTRCVRAYQPAGVVDPDDYCAFVAGSDQIWHRWTGHPGELDFFYLRFAPREKRIAYAASFGFSALPERDLAVHTQGLNGIPQISCRERSGCELVEKYTGRPAELVLDPTLCIGAEEWRRLEEKPAYADDRPYALFFVLGARDRYLALASAYAGAHDLRLIDLTSPADARVWKTAMGGFLWLVEHAACVFTDSFHCTAFALQFGRPLMVFRRTQPGKEDMFDRIGTLLQLAGLEGCEYPGGDITEVSGTGAAAPMERLKPMIDRSKAWLKNALDTASAPRPLPAPSAAAVPPEHVVCPPETCCACQACVNVCPVRAIRMEELAGGERFPIIDEARCIHCDACRRVCPRLNEVPLNPPKACWAAQRKDEAGILSSSAGIAAAIAEETVAGGGAVFGVRIAKDLSAVHACAETPEDLAPMRTSKYLRSDTGSAYSGAKRLLDAGRSVTFFGTPCQIAGLRTYLGRAYDGLLCVDIICHGTPPAAYWLQHLANMTVNPVDGYVFRGNGKDDHVMRLYRNGSAVYQIPCKDDPYYDAFIRGVTLCESCYQCPYARPERAGDITLGDFWGLDRKTLRTEMDGRISLVFANTEAGQAFLGRLRPKLAVEERSVEEALNGNANLRRPTPKSPFRGAFLASYRELRDFDRALAASGALKDFESRRPRKKPSFFKRAVRKLKRYL